MSSSSGEVYTELYRAVHRALSAIRNNGVSAFQGEVYTGRIGPIVGTLESVCIIEVSAFQGCLQGGVPLEEQLQAPTCTSQSGFQFRKTGTVSSGYCNFSTMPSTFTHLVGELNGFPPVTGSFISLTDNEIKLYSHQV